MELSFKYMLSVLFTALITFLMIGLLGLFLNFSARKVELEKIINTIETSADYENTVNRLNDRKDLVINEFEIGDKRQYYVELTSNYRLMGSDLKFFKLKGYTKVLEM